MSRYVKQEKNINVLKKSGYVIVPVKFGSQA